MRRLAAALLAGGALLGGCGVSTVDQTYDDAVIRDVGGGSVALGGLLSTLQGLDNLPGFTDPSINRSMTLLFQGQLNKLTEEDLVRMAKTNRQGFKRMKKVLGKLDGISSDIRTARVDVRAHNGLSDGTKRFLRAWNDYLTANAGRVRSTRRVFAGMRPLFNEFQSLLRAAYDTRRGSTTRFDRLRRRVALVAAPLIQGFQKRLNALTANSPADHKFVDLVNRNQEAQAIVKKVNERYPHGWLAELQRKA